MNRLKFIVTLLMCCQILSASQDKMLDFWDDAPRLFGTAAQGQSIDRDLNMRGRINYTSEVFKIDRSDFMVGDFSILYLPAKAGKAQTFGFVSSLWGLKWQLDKEMSLHFFIKTAGSNIPLAMAVSLTDAAGKKAAGVIEGINADNWTAIELKLSSLKEDAGFNWAAVRMCEFNAPFGGDAKVWLDGIRFEGAGKFVGVTDKPLRDWIADAAATREVRITESMSLAARKDSFEVVMAFAKMYMNEDLDTANEMLLKTLQDKKSDDWSLLHTPLYCRFYYFFSNRAGKYPGRMTPEVEKVLLETIWQRTEYKNDIHWARQSTWWMDGSENHDINAKACNLVTARIFMNEPDYKDRSYPNLGYGGGYHYGRAGYYGKGVDPSQRHGGGRANLSDGKTYTIKDNYEAWLTFMKEYFSERARRGFYLERAAPGYTKHTFNFVELAYSHSGDAELKKIIGQFLDIFWADCAQESIGSDRGGAKSRHHKSVGGANGGVWGLINFQLGGPGNGNCWWYYNMMNDYQLPEAIWAMSIDRQGMGCYEYKSRGIGEEENTWPRPLGTERTLLCDTDSRFLKYSYVTPDYILGTQMDHPAAIHSHLSYAGRWHGMIFAQSDAARIVPIGIPTAEIADKLTGKLPPVDMEVMYRTVQHKNTLIVQQAWHVMVAQPTWYPSYQSRYEKPIGVWLGTDWDELIEKDGWIFVQKGSAYAAVRVVLWDEEFEKQKKMLGEGAQMYFNSAYDDPTVKLREDCYKWNEERTYITLENKFSPVIIEAGRKADHPTLADFMADVLDNPIELYKTVVPGFNILVYTGCGDDAPEIEFNAANNSIPTIGGEYIDYSYPKLFDSPYLQSDYKSGLIKASFAGEQVMWDFGN